MFWLLIALATTQVTKQDCSFDREALLELDQNAFDQDLAGGWRALEMRGCEREAADLVGAYRQRHQPKDASILYWHEGQLRADIGQTARAISLFERSRRPPAKDEIGWNVYVDGSIAFLRHDVAGLRSARARLAALPASVPLPTFKYQGRTVSMAWPPNLNVLDGFLHCFDKPYKDAYGCAKPFMRVPG